MGYQLVSYEIAEDCLANGRFLSRLNPRVVWVFFFKSSNACSSKNCLQTILEGLILKKGQSEYPFGRHSTANEKVLSDVTSLYN